MIKEAEALLAVIEDEREERKTAMGFNSALDKFPESRNEAAGDRPDLDTADRSNAAITPDTAVTNHVEINQSLEMGQSVKVGQSVEQKVDDDDNKNEKEPESSPKEEEKQEQPKPAQEEEKKEGVLTGQVRIPTLTRDMLDLVVEKDSQKRLRYMRYKQTKAERAQLAVDFTQEILARLSECTKGKFEARFGEEEMTRKAEYNLKYCSGPGMELLDQYNKLVDDAQYEINSCHGMLDTKKLDIAKIIQENNKFLAQSGSKRSWQQYESTLAVERVVNDRLINELAKSYKVE